MRNLAESSMAFRVLQGAVDDDTSAVVEQAVAAAPRANLSSRAIGSGSATDRSTRATSGVSSFHAAGVNGNGVLPV